MCGIAGIIYRNGAHPIGHDMTRMLQSMKHRGPDSTGFALYGPPGDTVVMRYTLADANDARDQARRFVTLIDELYEHRVNVVIAAAAAPERLYPSGDGSFDFGRTVSRLNEMQSVDYLTRPHLT